jgi:uncharacterized protein YerC
MRKALTRVKPPEETAVLDALYNVIRDFEDNKSMADFINKFLTKSERLVVGRRILIANLLLKGHTYFEINDKLNVSPNTIARVKIWLDSEFPDYEKILEKESSHGNKSKIYKRTEPFSLKHLKKKYPLHFLLLSLIEKK